MKRFILPISICLLLLLSLAAPALGAQDEPATPGIRQSISQVEAGPRPKPVAVMYDPNATPIQVDAPALPAGGLGPQSANFVIDYVEYATNALGDSCGAFPDQARAPMEAAAAIWANFLNSTVPIRIEACFADLDAGVLGWSSSLGTYRDFSGAPTANTWYPVALANALHGSDLNPSKDDISIAYANYYMNTFYYGTDGHPGSGLTDFESVILHEIGHGLGFAGSMQTFLYNGSNYATWGYCAYGSDYIGCPQSPEAYDRFTTNSSGTLLIGAYPGYTTWTTDLYSALTNGAVYFNGPNARAANGGNKVPLYAPNPWKPGSSYSHVAENFNGTINAMMTYSIGKNESIHDPGPIMMGALKDIGWSTNYIKIAAPTALIVTPASATQINLSWTDNGDMETGFKIERSTNDTSHWGVLTTTSTPDTTYSDTPLAPGTRFYYRISAVYPGPQSSSPSPTVAGITPLIAATGLNAAPFSPTQINLTWTDTNNNESGYKVERSPDGATGWSTIATTGASVQAFNNTGLTEGTPYFYRLSAVNGVAASPTIPVDAITQLKPPTGLAAVPASTTQVNLAWTDVSGKESGYVVQRGPSASGPWDVLTTTAAGVHAYNDPSAFEGSAYFYAVYATNTLLPATSTPAVTAAAAIVPLQPASGVSAAMGPVGWVVVSWTDVSGNETGYKVERTATGGAPWTNLTPVLLPGGATSFSDTTTLEKKTLTYRVTAINAATTAQSTPAASNAIVTPLAAPANLAAVPVLGGGKILIQWTDASAAETGYEITVYNPDTTNWDVLAITTANVSSYLWLQPVNGVYFIRVRTLTTPASGYVTVSATLDTQWMFIPAVKR